MELSQLRAEVVWLKRENEIIRSSGVLREGCPVKYAWIEEHGKSFGLTEMYAVLDVSSGYRACKRGGKPDRKRLTEISVQAPSQANLV